MEFCKKFGEIVQENWWNFKEIINEFEKVLVKSWEKLKEILEKKIGEVLEENFAKL